MERETPLTVADLIERLRSLPQDARVVVEGYEHGFSDVFADQVHLMDLELGTLESDPRWWHGLHRPYETLVTTPPPVVAVVIDRLGADDNAERLGLQ